MLKRSALDTWITWVDCMSPVSWTSSMSCVVYSYDSDGVRTPERPTRKFIPMRGATARPVPISLTYAAPRPRPPNANIVRLNGTWYDGSTRADHTVADESPALMFETPRMADSSRLSATNQPIVGDTFTVRKSGAIMRPAEPPSSRTPARP